jgi:hypothetical protein
MGYDVVVYSRALEMNLVSDKAVYSMNQGAAKHLDT